MQRVVSTLRFLRDSKTWSGAVEVLEVVDEDQQDHIYIRMRVGERSIRLPRTGLRAIIEALEKADAEAADRYAQLVRRMNGRRTK